MNPRQRQGLLLVVVAAIGLVGVFLLIANYVSTVSKQVGPKVRVLALTSSLAPYQPVTASQLHEVLVPAKWAPPNALQDPSQAVGLISPIALPANDRLEQGMLTSAPAVQPGQRGLPVPIDAATVVAAQLQPGSVVDIIGTFQGSTGSRDSARVIVASARVLSVGTPVGAGSSGGSSGGNAAASSGGSVPVTFALTPEQALHVSYAESFAQNVRLSVVAPGSTEPPANLPPYSPAGQ